MLTRSILYVALESSTLSRIIRELQEWQSEKLSDGHAAAHACLAVLRPVRIEGFGDLRGQLMSKYRDYM